MGAFTVPTEACTASLNWTGVEAAFAAGFPALDPSHVSVTYAPAVGAPIALTPGIQVTVACDPATGAVTVTPLAMPAAPGVVTIDRHTPANQGTNFANLASFSADSHTLLADQAEMGIAEMRRDLARAIIGTAIAPAPSVAQRILTAGGPFNLLATDRELLVNFAGPVTINVGSGATRFAAQLDMSAVTIKDISGAADAHTVTINFTADLCDGKASQQILTRYGGFRLRPIQTGGWMIV